MLISCFLGMSGNHRVNLVPEIGVEEYIFDIIALSHDVHDDLVGCTSAPISNENELIITIGTFLHRREALEQCRQAFRLIAYRNNIEISTQMISCYDFWSWALPGLGSPPPPPRIRHQAMADL